MNKRNAKINGIGSINGSTYDEIVVDGLGKVKEDLECSKLEIKGMLKSKGKITSTTFICKGLSRIFKDMKAKECVIKGLVKLRRAKLEADSIMCKGIIVSNKEVSADAIEVNGLCSIAEMYGDNVILKRDDKSITDIKIPYKLLPFLRVYLGRKVSLSHSIINSIECTHIYADNLKAKSIKAESITLGPNCEIGKVDCIGQLKYDSSTTIKDIKAGSVCKGGEEMNSESIKKILEMYKEGTIALEEAQQMVDSIYGKIYSERSCEKNDEQ